MEVIALRYFSRLWSCQNWVLVSILLLAPRGIWAGDFCSLSLQAPLSKWGCALPCGVEGISGVDAEHLALTLHVISPTGRGFACFPR